MMPSKFHHYYHVNHVSKYHEQSGESSITIVLHNGKFPLSSESLQDDHSKPFSISPLSKKYANTSQKNNKDHGCTPPNHRPPKRPPLR